MTQVISIMTDFGLRDGFVGVMKGVILGITPGVSIVDISHLISPQNIQEGAVIFDNSAPYFPPGAIHICVVDPGVGTARRPLAARIGTQIYVGPDNGLITLFLARAEREGWSSEFYHIDQPRFWLPVISTSFHGRDIFAPVAAHLAQGVPFSDIGSPITDPVLLPLSLPERTTSGLQGVIRHIDHFGNISTNLRSEHLAGLENVVVRACGVSILGLARTFGDRPPGELIAYLSSMGHLSIAVVNGNAAQRLNAHVGDAVEVEVLTRP